MCSKFVQSSVICWSQTKVACCLCKSEGHLLTSTQFVWTLVTYCTRTAGGHVNINSYIHMYEHLRLTAFEARRMNLTLPGFSHDDDQRQHQKDHNTLHPEEQITVATSRIIHCLHSPESKLITSHLRDFAFIKVTSGLNWFLTFPQLVCQNQRKNWCHRQQSEHCEI